MLQIIGIDSYWWMKTRHRLLDWFRWLITMVRTEIWCWCGRRRCLWNHVTNFGSLINTVGLAILSLNPVVFNFDMPCFLLGIKDVTDGWFMMGRALMADYLSLRSFFKVRIYWIELSKFILFILSHFLWTDLTTMIAVVIHLDKEFFFIYENSKIYLANHWNCSCGMSLACFFNVTTSWMTSWWSLLWLLLPCIVTSWIKLQYVFHSAIHSLMKQSLLTLIWYNTSPCSLWIVSVFFLS